jgi:hypothetical protein
VRRFGGRRLRLIDSKIPILRENHVHKIKKGISIILFKGIPSRPVRAQVSQERVYKIGRKNEIVSCVSEPLL